MWRFLVCLMFLLVGCQPLATPVTPPKPVTQPQPAIVEPQAEPQTPAQAPNTQIDVTIPANTEIPVTISTPTENITVNIHVTLPPVAEPVVPAAIPQPQLYVTVGDISYPIAGVPPSNPDYYKFPPLTEERIRKAESVLCVRAREMDGGPCSTCDNLTAVCGKGFNSVGTGYVGGGLGIYTYYQEGGTVYELFLKDIGKPTQEILGYGEIDQNTGTLR